MIGLPYNSHTGISGGKFFQNIDRIVRRAIIYTDDLQIFICLRAETIQAPGQILLSVIDRDNNTDERKRHKRIRE